MQLLTSTQGHIVHIWDTVKWRSQCWEFDSSCDTAAWSANGSMLLIGTSESFISSLDFSKKASTLSTNFPIDVSGTDAVGGIVDMLAWSPTNERLAVSFRGHHMGFVPSFFFSVSDHIPPGQSSSRCLQLVWVLFFLLKSWDLFVGHLLLRLRSTNRFLCNSAQPFRKALC